MPIIYIEGNIGAGKSTLLTELMNVLPNAIRVPEPIDFWNSYTSEGKTILEMYYKDPVKYAAFFQNVVIQSKMKIMLDIITSATQDRIYIMERSFYSDFYVFGEILRSSEMITALEYQYLKSWFDIFVDSFQKLVTGIVYIDVPINVCQTRIIKRSRDGESNIEDSYLESIEKAYKTWMNSETKVPVWCIDANTLTTTEIADLIIQKLANII
jgi:deoxyadenosine/deoxycytidine kinase